jgi:fructose-specific phosphotransferase system IIC component
MKRQLASSICFGLAAYAGLAMVGCSQAPSYDVAGSIFPAWLVCIIAGSLFAFLGRWLLLQTKIRIIFPVLVYPSLAAAFTFAIWLVFYQ